MTLSVIDNSVKAPATAFPSDPLYDSQTFKVMQVVAAIVRVFGTAVLTGLVVYFVPPLVPILFANSVVKIVGLTIAIPVVAFLQSRSACYALDTYYGNRLKYLSISLMKQFGRVGEEMQKINPHMRYLKEAMCFYSPEYTSFGELDYGLSGPFPFYGESSAEWGICREDVSESFLKNFGTLNEQKDQFVPYPFSQEQKTQLISQINEVVRRQRELCAGIVIREKVFQRVQRIAIPLIIGIAVASLAPVIFLPVGMSLVAKAVSSVSVGLFLGFCPAFLIPLYRLSNRWARDCGGCQGEIGY